MVAGSTGVHVAARTGLHGRYTAGVGHRWQVQLSAKRVQCAGIQECLDNCWQMKVMTNDIDGAKHRVKSAAESFGCHSNPEKTWEH